MTDGLPPTGEVLRRLCRELLKRWTREGAMTSVRCIRLDTAGNRGFSGARIVPGADAWRERETSMRLDPDGWLVRRNIADATIMKTRMCLRSHIGGGVCRAERNEKKCQKLCKGDVLPLDRSLLMGGFSDTQFQQVCMGISGRYPMKVLHPQWVMNTQSLIASPPAPAPLLTGAARRSSPWICTSP